MNPLDPDKLLHSKWTAVNPVDREKHFIVTGLRGKTRRGARRCVLEAVRTRRSQEVAAEELRDESRWRAGWR
jgi:tryptophan-rich hypothetical protein